MRAWPLLFLCVPLLIPAPACVGCNEGRWGYASGIFDRYTLGSLSVTPGGVHYDPSGQTVDPSLLDAETNEVEACLGRSLDRASFVVKVASDWHLGCYGDGQQLLPVLAPMSACTSKGLVPTSECPCYYRAGIQCPNILVVTDNLLLYKDVLIRWTLGISDPWTPEYATCATP